MLKKILDNLRYPSTWKGLIALLSVIGVSLSPDQLEAITAAGVALYGAISLFFSDSDVPKAK